MTEDDERVADLLRSAAGKAERAAPAFDVDRIIATAHRRRPWLAALDALRRGGSPVRPVLAMASVVALVAVAVVLVATHAFSGGGSRIAGGTTPTTQIPASTTTLPGTTTPATTTTSPTSTTTTMPPPTSTTTTLPRYTYTAVWRGHSVDLTNVPDVDMRRFADARIVGTVSGFSTHDPRFVALNGRTLDVWSAPHEYPGELAVDNGSQAGQPVHGTWTFPD